MFDPKYLESGEFYQRRYHNFSTIIIFPIFFLVIFFVVFSLFAKRELTVKSNGQIIPDKVISTIQSTSNNEIERNYLVENKFVKRGETLITFKNNKAKISKELIDDEINDTNERLKSLDQYQRSIIKGTSQFKVTNNFGYDDLFNRYINQINILDENSNQKINNLKQHELVNVKKEISTQKQSLAELKVKQQSSNEDYQNNIINSPENGVLHLESNKINTKYLPKGETLAEIYPRIEKNTQLHVSYAISPEDITDIRIGQKIRFVLNENVSKPLVLNGEIINIGTAPISDKEKTFFVCEAKLTIPNVDYKRIKYGIIGRVTTIKGSKTWFNYYKDLVLKDK